MSRRKNKRKEVFKSCKFTYTTRLETLLFEISDNISYAIIGSHLCENEFGYKLLDMSEPFKFKVYIEDRKSIDINIKLFLDNFFNKKFNNKEINNFIYRYNKLLKPIDNKEFNIIDVSPYEEEIFIYKPNDVLYTFNSLCYQTYPHGSEHKILKYIPIPLIEDDFGNYYIKIGESNTMFTSHFDSACKNEQIVKLISFEKEGHTFISSNGKSILSADDKAGVTIMLYMIENKIPGLYYFFIGEEVGGIGSGNLSTMFSNYEYLKNINKCVSFDRRDYYSVITHQGYARTCSDKFAQSICDELNKNGLEYNIDNTGIFTDSANFIDYIGECTNISIGYFNEHTFEEYQNITFLESLCKVCLNIKFDELEVYRKIGFDREVIDNNHELLLDLKNCAFYSMVRLKKYEERTFVEMKLISNIFSENFEDITLINELFYKYRKNPYIYFADDEDGNMIMNIELE